MKEDKSSSEFTEIRVLITTTRKLDHIRELAKVIVTSVLETEMSTKFQLVEKETRVKEVSEGTKNSINLILQD